MTNTVDDHRAMGENGCCDKRRSHRRICTLPAGDGFVLFRLFRRGKMVSLRIRASLPSSSCSGRSWGLGLRCVAIFLHYSYLTESVAGEARIRTFIKLLSWNVLTQAPNWASAMIHVCFNSLCFTRVVKTISTFCVRSTDCFYFFCWGNKVI